MSSGLELMVDSHHGTYLPQVANEVLKEEWFRNISQEDRNTLNDPNDEWYWESWNTVLDNADFIDKDGNTWVLYQDGDLWAVCYELMTEQEKNDFFGEDNY